jgi:hypothetical protein
MFGTIFLNLVKKKIFPVLFIVSYFLVFFQEEPEDHDELSSERLRSKPNGEFAFENIVSLKILVLSNF